MYYDTPNLSPYVSFIKKNRLIIIMFIFILGLGAFLSINTNLFSSDERIWLQDSLELKRTENNNLESKYVSKISLHINNFDTDDIDTLKKLDNVLKTNKDVTFVSSLLSQKHFYNDKDSDVSALVKVINTYSLSNSELQDFIQNFQNEYKSYINFEDKTFTLYVFTKESFQVGKLDKNFDVEIEQISSDNDK